MLSNNHCIFLTELWYDLAGIELKSEKFGDVPSLEELKRTEWDPRFEALMRNRLIMGRFRYGPFWHNQSENFDYIGYSKKKLELYEKTGNTELLVDCANLCMKEFAVGEQPNKHFKAEDDVNHVERKR